MTDWQWTNTFIYEHSPMNTCTLVSLPAPTALNYKQQCLQMKSKTSEYSLAKPNTSRWAGRSSTDTWWNDNNRMQQNNVNTNETETVIRAHVIPQNTSINFTQHYELLQLHQQQHVTSPIPAFRKGFIWTWPGVQRTRNSWPNKVKQTKHYSSIWILHLFSINIH